MNENPQTLAPVEEPSEAIATAQPYTPTIWNDSKLLAQAFKAAKFLASSDIVPEQTYKDKPQNCLIALDLANRMNIPPLLVMQNLYIVKGKPAWSGSFCVAAINGCGRFSPLDFVMVEDGGGGCYCQATRLSDGKLLTSTIITMQMAKNEGWIDKAGSKWKTMPQQMLQYRAASFFARVHCPDVLFGVQTVEEVKDTAGYEETEKPVVTISFDSVEVSE